MGSQPTCMSVFWWPMITVKSGNINISAGTLNAVLLTIGNVIICFCIIFRKWFLKKLGPEGEHTGVS